MDPLALRRRITPGLPICLMVLCSAYKNAIASDKTPNFFEHFVHYFLSFLVWHFCDEGGGIID